MDASSQVTPRLLTMVEASVALGVSVRTLMRAMRRGELRSIRIGRSVRIEVPALRAYLDAKTR